MERFTLRLDTDNDAFRDEPASEIARLLRDAARRVEAGDAEGRLRDANGNTVGAFCVEG